MKRVVWVRVAWGVAGVLWVAGLLSFLIQFIWDKTFHDVFGWVLIDYADALGWAAVLLLIFVFIYLLKEDVRG